MLHARRTLKRLGISATAALLLVGPALPAAAVEKSVTEASAFAGQASSTTLRIALGDVEITVAGGDSMATYERSRVQVHKLDVDDRFVATCGPGSVAVAGADECLSRAELRAINFSGADADTVFGDALVAAGIASYVADRASDTLHGQDATATSKGIVIPGLATGEAACSSSKLAQDVVALATPEQLAPALVAKVGSASCRVAVTGLPTAVHSRGERFERSSEACGSTTLRVALRLVGKANPIALADRRSCPYRGCSVPPAGG